jgi:hypothetical protein
MLLGSRERHQSEPIGCFGVAFCVLKVEVKGALCRVAACQRRDQPSAFCCVRRRGNGDVTGDRDLARRPWVFDKQSAAVDRLLAASAPHFADRMFPEEYTAKYLLDANAHRTPSQ